MAAGELFHRLHTLLSAPAAAHAAKVFHVRQGSGLVPTAWLGACESTSKPALSSDLSSP
ncbi:hypothetical protein [Streptomyces melanosporofaciens]|uniref:hypothetical protein n=1 Tax=Streptomyces melanosporofaciens TaxID=67327 RepID=UPI001FCC93C4|nr:hypothetical protein [Streptomyces melanosporofaciens]